MLSNITTQLTDDKENGECFVYSEVFLALLAAATM